MNKLTNKLEIETADAQSGVNLEKFLDVTAEYFRENWPQNLKGHKDWRAHYTQWLKTRSKDGRRRLWIIKIGGKVAGLANFYSSGPEHERVGHVAEFYVRPDFRRRGVGQDIFSIIREELVKDECRIIKSEVQPDEPGRMNFWENLGFKVEKVQMALDLTDDGEEE
ncbi:MAG: GNAT family N-acetyltransferase [Planctomycetes bacterium]|nr:GNAT family N-acetyltransferase [Planctomycetota bacterium]